MSKQRIRYVSHKFKSNHKITCNVYTSESTGALYRVILNLDDMEFYIRNERTKAYVKKSNRPCNNLNVLKRNARKALESMGVVLDRESRSRSFGLCEKGYTMDKHLEKIREEKEDI